MNSKNTTHNVQVQNAFCKIISAHKEAVSIASGLRNRIQQKSITDIVKSSS